jgi:hypothetical protein
MYTACFVETILVPAYSELVLQLRAEVTLNGGSRFVRNAEDHPPAYAPNKTEETVFIAVRTSNFILLPSKVFLYLIIILDFILRMEAKSYKKLKLKGKLPTHTHTHTHTHVITYQYMLFSSL